MSGDASWQVRLSLFETPQIVRADGATVALRSRKHLALLIYLAIEQRYPSSRDTLSALLWPNVGEEAARNNLRVALADLRRGLGEGAIPFIQTTRLTVQFNSASGVTLDVLDFRQLIDGSNKHQHASLFTCPGCLNQLEQAVALYSGEFLRGFNLSDSSVFEEWVLIQREQLHQAALEALATLATACEQAGDHAAQCRYARRQIELEPWREQAHAQLMRGLWASGQRAAALEQYDVCCRILDAELGLGPSSELTALYDQLRASNELVGNETSKRTAPDPSSTPRPQPPIAQHNLPVPLTPFVGRTSELTELSELLRTADMRILTLVGVGGMGKTHLAIELARRNVDAFADGVRFVPLAPLARADELPVALLHALDQPPPRSDPMASLRHALRDKQLLLVLDNFEHLLDAATLVSELLQAAPRLQVLATSRERLNLRGEQRYLVQGLAFDPASSDADASELPAVKLFVQNARRVQPHFRLSPSDLTDVLQICRSLLGMPLGLELAAAWVALLPPSAIAAQIQRSHDFLASELRDLPERQRSMRAVFDWSWRLLRPEERRVFRQLAVFRGGFTLEAALSVAQATLPTVLRLVEHSLLQVGAGRYELHELLRQFAEEQLDAAGERSEVEGRYSQFFLHFIAEREGRIFRDQPMQAIAELRDELDNVRHAWRLASRQCSVVALGQSACTMAFFYKLSGAASEWEQLLVMSVTQLQGQLSHAIDDTQVRQVLSRLMALLGSVSIQQSKHAQAYSWAEQAIALGVASGDRVGEVNGMLVMGQVLRRRGQSEEARTLLERTATLAQRYQQSGSWSEQLPEVEFVAYNWLCSIAVTSDEYTAASHYVAQGMQLCQRLGKAVSTMISQSDMFDIALATGDNEAARFHGEETLRLAQELKYERMEAAMSKWLGVLACLQGEYVRAHELIAQALVSYQLMGDLVGETRACSEIAHVRLLLGDYADAQRWLDRALDALRAADMPAREQLQTWLRLAQLAHAVGDDERALIYATQAVEMAQQLDGATSQMQALSVLGLVYTRMGQLEQARHVYEQALACTTDRDRAAMTALPHAGLALLALDGNEQAAALAHVEVLLPVLADPARAGLDEPFRIYLACYRVLEATSDPRADSLLAQAHQQLERYASQISDSTLREAFLHLPTNQALLSAQEQMLVRVV